MNIIHTLSLSQKQLTDIRSITGLCRQMDGCTLSCPEDGDAFWLLYDENREEAKGVTAWGETKNAGQGRPEAFFAVYRIDDSCLECYAFTRPDCRRRGYFSALLHEVCAWCQESGEPELCFVTDHKCGDALEILGYLEAEFWYDEYMMERRIGRDGAECPKQPKAHAPGCNISLIKHGTEWEMAAPWGSCRLTLLGERAYLYGLEILPSLRGRGMGTRFVREILSILENHGCRSLRLQVSGANEAALGLYKKTGFRITQTLSYYLY